MKFVLVKNVNTGAADNDLRYTENFFGEARETLEPHQAVPYQKKALCNHPKFYIVLYGNFHRKELRHLLANMRGEIDGTNNDGNSALHLAVFQENENLVHVLLERGASMFLLNKMGTSPLSISEQRNLKNIIYLFNYFGRKCYSAAEDIDAVFESCETGTEFGDDAPFEDPNEILNGDAFVTGVDDYVEPGDFYPPTDEKNGPCVHQAHALGIEVALTESEEPVIERHGFFARLHNIGARLVSGLRVVFHRGHHERDSR